jgi:type I restriction enzyme S subunit
MNYKYEPIGKYYQMRKGLGYLGKYLTESSVGLVGLNSFEGGGGYKYGGEKKYSGPFKTEHIAQIGDLFISTTDITQDGRVLASPFILPDLTTKFKTVIFSGDIVKAEKIKDGLMPEFLFNILRVKKFREKAAYASSGTTVRRIPSAVIESLEVPVPGLIQQEIIVKLMTKLDSKIRNNFLMSRTLEDITQSIFKSWFVDFDPVKAKRNGKNPIGMEDETALLFPNSFEESELGPIPKGWSVNSLFESGLEIESGSRPKGGVKGISSGIPSIGAESINGLGIFEFSKTKYVPRDFFAKMNKGKPKDFDILLYKDGGKPGEFKPRVGMYGLGFPFEEFAINEHVFILRSLELGQPYLYFWICLERTLDILRNRGVKAAIPGINQQDVGTIPTLIPSEKVLKAFNQIVTPYITLILTLSNQSLQLAKLRDKLLPRLVSGELQIPEEMLAP